MIAKDFIRKIVKPILYVDAPKNCELSTNLCELSGFSLKSIYPQQIINYELLSHGQFVDFVKSYNLTQLTVNAEFLLTLKQGRIFGEGVILTPNGQTIIRDLSIDFGKSLNEHYLLNANYFKKPKYLRKDTACTASNGGSTFYHWMFDVLPRIVNLLKFYQPSRLITQTYNGRLQEILSHRLENIEIIEPHAITHYRCENLLVPSFVGFSGNPTPRSCELILEAFSPHLDSLPNLFYDSHIYISRQYTKVRKVVNEDVLFEQLSETLNFKRIYLEQLTWKEQISVFRNARFIISPHGAGLSNLVFCQAKTNVVEIFNPRYLHWCYWQLSSVRGLNYYPYFETPNHVAPCHNMSDGVLDIQIDVSQFLKFIHDLI